MLLKPSNRNLIAFVVAAGVISVGIIIYGSSQLQQVSQPVSNQALAAPERQKVSALGRIEPEAKVISVAGPLTLDGDRIKEILIKESDRVRNGQLLAILDSVDRLENAVQEAEAQVDIARAKLRQVKAGAKSGDIRAQQATVQRLQAQSIGDFRAQEELIARLIAQYEGDRAAQQATIGRLTAEFNIAQAEYQRYQQLFKEGAISNSVIDSKRLALETSRQELNEAKAVLDRIDSTANKQLAEARITLNRIGATTNQQISEAKATLSSVEEVRSVDIQLAQAELKNAQANLERTKTELDKAYIRAPMAGTVIKINKRVGEKIPIGMGGSNEPKGIIELANTEQMVVVAEVYQSDIGKVKVGQNAIMTSDAFTERLSGTIYEITQQVTRQNVFSNEPGENLDSRVVEVKIRLTPEDSKKVVGFTNLQVQTSISL
jgi:HlyD family secretion protein